MADLISVLIPTYNRAGMIGNAIGSILNQTYGAIEIVVYDDGSTDKTRKMLKKKYGKRIRVIGNLKNMGCAYARNRLLEAASGKYACWQDSDDWSNINRLQYQYDQICCGHKLVVTRGRRAQKITNTNWRAKPSPSHKPGKRNKNFINASAMFALTDAIPVCLEKSYGGSDAVWIRAMIKKFGVYTIGSQLYYVRDHHDRIGVWKRRRAANPEWYDRMIKYKTSK